MLRTVVVDDDLLVLSSVAAACRKLLLSEPAIAASLSTAVATLCSAQPTVCFVKYEWAAQLLAELPSFTALIATIVVGPSIRAEHAFDYAASGADAVLEPPISVEQVIPCMEAVLHGPSVLDRVAGSLVGRRGLKDIQRSVRKAMFTVALNRAAGNRHAAARMLDVDRRAVQLAVKEFFDGGQPGQEDPRPAFIGGRRDPIRTSPLAEEEARRLVDLRVGWYGKGVIFWHELPVQSEASVTYVFERIESLSNGGRDQIRLLIDLSEASYPSAATRECLRLGFARASNIEHVAVFVGDNEALSIAARFVLAPMVRCEMTVHSGLTPALAAVVAAG